MSSLVSIPTLFRWGWCATLGHTGNATGLKTHTPPTSGRDNDWLLVLDASANFPPPGTTGTPD